MFEQIKRAYHFGLVTMTIKTIEQDFRAANKGQKFNTTVWASKIYHLTPLKYRQVAGGKVTREGLKEKLDSIMELYM